MWCVVVEPKVITKVIEIDETAPRGPATYPPYWPPIPGAGQLPQPPQSGTEAEEEAGETIERRPRERKGASAAEKVFEDNMMDYAGEKAEKDDDDKDDDRRKKKKKKQKRKRQKKKKRKPKRQKQKKQRQKQRKRRQRRSKRQKKRKQ